MPRMQELVFLFLQRQKWKMKWTAGRESVNGPTTIICQAPICDVLGLVLPYEEGRGPVARPHKPTARSNAY